MVKITKAFSNKLEKDPNGVLSTLSEEDLVRIIQKANYDYYNTSSPLFSDDMYDLTKEFLEAKNPNHPILKSVGAAATSGEKVELPYFIGSLDKIKSDDRLLEKFKHAYTCSYVVSDKLDGNSALYFVDQSGSPKMFSRGDGTIGQDISHLIPFVKNIPATKLPNMTAVRGELIMSRNDFTRVADKGANARNMVAGIINAKLPDLELAKYVQFVAYELIHPREAPEVQFSTLQGWGFTVAHHEVVSDHALSNDLLSSILTKRRKESPFEVDGIVIMHNALHKRVKENPKYAFAFKSVQTMEKAEVIVTKIEWNMSKDGYMIPTVVFNPVHLAGVTIQKATGFNGKYIKDNTLGPGSRVIIMRSGDVIPYIVEVLSPAASGEPHMPEIPYAWSKSGVDIHVKKVPGDQSGEVSQQLKLKNIEYFFDKVDIKGVSTGTITKIFNAGFKDIKSIANITKHDLLNIPGFKEKSATNIVDALAQGVKNVPCVTLMDASNTLGRGMGAKKIQMIVAEYPHILSKRYIPTVGELVKIKGVEKKTAELFIENLPNFFAFYDSCGVRCAEVKEQDHDDDSSSSPVHEKKKKRGTKYADMTFVFTGFRDKQLEQHIEENGGIITNTISRKTKALIVKDTNGKETGKVQKIREIEEKYNIKIPVLTLEEFKKWK